MALKVGNLLATLKAETGQFDKKMKGATAALVSPSGLVGAFKAVTVGVAAFGAAATAASIAIAKFTNRGGQVLNVQRAFTKATGGSATAIRKLQDATEGLISNYDLMVGMNRALALGAANNAEQFGELSRTAITLGRALGVDATFAMESLSLGIGRQSRLILDNLGLIVSVETANKKYAAALGKTVAQLTEVEKKEAFRTAAMEAARSKIEQLGGIQETNADTITRLRVAYVNFRDELAMLVATAPVVREYFEGLTRAARSVGDALSEQLDPGGFGRQLADLQRNLQQQSITGAAQLLEGEKKRLNLLTRQINAMKERFGSEENARRLALGYQEAEREILFVVREIAAITQRIAQLQREAAAAADDTNEALKRVQRTGQALPIIFQIAGDALRENFPSIRSIIEKDLRGFELPDDMIESAKADLLRMIETTELKETLTKSVKEGTDDFKKIGKMAGRKLVDGIIDGSLDMEALLKSVLGALAQRALFSGLGILSPSKLGIEAGEKLQLGIVQGMANMNRMVTGAVTSGIGGSLDRATPASVAPAQPFNVNMPALPEPVTPEAQAVNSYWIRVWTATARAARQRGFRE
jgi:hypothetical protein